MVYYETHMHTSEGSACARSTGAEQAVAYKNAGFSGIIITDHFFNGNCAVPKIYSWKEKVNHFCLGYEHAKEKGEEIGLSVFFGWEANFGGTEFLIYGLDKYWLLQHPDILTWSVETQYRKIKEAGGLVIQAHPYREDWYINEIRLFPKACDGVEVYNVGNEFRNPKANDLAWYYAKAHGFPMTCGSDCHHVDGAKGGMGFETPLSSLADFKERILKKEGILCPRVPGEVYQPGRKEELPESTAVLYDHDLFPC